ncbi:NAD-glutamate dehydrogenase [Phreatobacter sp.]|uniref:NAD-glutamate dehydrogenase n=1 Tax=Phreatobacter sp. TaxID=1966341 RepID=UPI003F727AB8
MTSGMADAGAGRATIEQAETILRGTEDAIPSTFVADLFGRADPEDLAGYEGRDLAVLAAGAFRHLGQRAAGQSRLTVHEPDPTSATSVLSGVTVIEAVNENMPFLVDSVLGVLTELGMRIRLVCHPIVTIEREPTGELSVYRGLDHSDPAAPRESLIHIHVDRVADDGRRAVLVSELEATLADVRICVADWRPMITRVQAIIEDLKSNPVLPVTEMAEGIQFLEWLASNNFTFLGVRDYAYVGGVAEGQMEPEFTSGLGILRDENVRILRRGTELVTMTPEMREFLMQPVPLIITKANVRSRVHRRVHMDYVGVKRFDRHGNLVGEARIVGLFTSTAYTRSTRTIPYLRRKVDRVLTRAGFDPDGHSGKSLVNVLEGYPRDELFQIDDDTLFVHAMAVMQLEDRPRVRVLPRADRFDRFVSIMVFVPRDRFDTTVRIAIGNHLASVYQGRVSAYYPFFPEGPLTRVHFIIGRTEGETPRIDRATLEQAVARIVRTWGDGLAEAIQLVHDPARAGTLASRYRDAFSAAYREAVKPDQAISDIRILESLSDNRPLAIDFYRNDPAVRIRAGLKVFARGRPIPLSERVPILEAMGFAVVDERTYEVMPSGPGADIVWLHDMSLARPGGDPIDLEALDEKLEAALMAVMRGDADSDGFNALTLEAGLAWRDVALIRTLARMLRQIRVPFSQDYLWATLRRHTGITKGVVLMFHLRFDPRLTLSVQERLTKQADVTSRLEEALAQVSSLDEDRILRAFINLVQAAVRTNFYQTGEDGRVRPTIAIKFESRKIDKLPAPKPLYEIFVYSPRVEGVHMRFGKVARGGLRWSDRPQDFRTEVLGLVKAQQVKNAVIVPVGAKGGFVPKRLPPASQRDAWLAEGTESYRIFVRSLLQITDNIEASGIVPPADTVRHDGDDPYLVVAADKGTATFSDTANQLSLEKGHWLGDAFASGGSQGYDHKGMGITARGAWEAVKRHFRETGTDIGVTPFSVAGVGDMSGDVFGNGMLLERTIRLVAAFDHRDIFLDPSPDPEASWAERRRLFDMPRSSWADYDKTLISAGGGVFPRSAKSIALSPEVQAVLDLPKAEATPQEVMNAILKAPVDLLFFGGIGTYVRASGETDDEVGDRANDAIRVTGMEIRAKVVGEGANLGMTQRGRIEAGRRGVRLNTDAIDNAAGVNTSDVEVNIKIALTTPERDGRLDPQARNALLADMTEEVGRLVLRNNYLQTLALSLSQRRGLEELGFQQRLMQSLETQGKLDRAVEYLPDDAEIAERRRRGDPLTRPEIAVLIAYAKIDLYDDLLDSTVPDDPYLSRELVRYFPRPIQEQYPDAVESHRLRREIIATGLSNSMINRGGPAFVARLIDQTGADVAAIASAFAAVRDAYGMTALNTELDTLDNRVAGQIQLELYGAIQDLLIDRVVWFIRNVDLTRGLADVIAHHRSGIEQVAASLDTVLPPDAAARRAARMAELHAAGVPDPLASVLAGLDWLAIAPDIVAVADATGRPVADVAATTFAASAAFRLDEVKAAARTIAVTDYFDRLALDRALDSIAVAERRLAADMMTGPATGEAAVAAWMAVHGGRAERIRTAVAEIAGSGLTVSKATVAASLLGDLVRE